MIRYCTLVFLFVSSIAFAQENTTKQKYDVTTEVDVAAEYPGGLTAFFAYLQQEMKYPVDANLKRIEGKVFVAFIVDGSGFIIPGSVTMLRSLYPSCDEEAMRVIRTCTIQWKAALKDGKKVSQRFVLPVNFNLTPGPSSTGPMYTPEYPIRTVVVANVRHVKDTTTWSLYGGSDMKIKVGKATIGDSVKVMGWAPWAYYIESGTSSGYISWKALKVTEELYHLSKIIEEKSEELYKPDPDPRSIHTRARRIKANAFFSLTADKKNITVGECVTVTMAFNVHPDNKAPIQFYGLAEQLNQLIPSIASGNDYYIVHSGMADVVGVTESINDINYTTYEIYKASYCPVTAGILPFPALPLQIANVRAGADGSDSIITFKTQPLSIKVNSLPADVKPSMHNGMPLVGKFTLTDSLFSEKISAGQPVTYEVTISGKGLTFPIEAPEIKIPEVSVRLQDIVDYDSIVGDQLISKKSFVYQLAFQKRGVYDFKGKIIFHSFNPSTKKIEILTSSSKVNVSGADAAESVNFISTFDAKQHFIAIDASQSMAIEDYPPYRLAAVRNGLKEFLMSRENCNIGLILFGGDAKHYTLPDANKCFTRRFIDSIGFNHNKRGTAIGDAIWLAKTSFAKDKLPKKLVIIGDGDNTAGHISPKMAATFARKDNIIIYTIGIGTTGLVPYGTDAEGKTNMIDNTFTDKDLKMISSITNGKYYWAKDAKDVERILKIIFGP